MTAIATNTILSPLNAAINLTTGRSITITGDNVAVFAANPIGETVSGAKAAGSFISKAWNSLW